MATNPLITSDPLLSQLIAQSKASGPLSTSQVISFINSALSDSNNYYNFNADGSIITSQKVTILYAGTTNGTYNGALAVDLANRIGTDARVLDNTKIGRLLGALTSGEPDVQAALAGVFADSASVTSFASSSFNTASDKFVSLAQGKIIALIGSDADLSKVFVTTEIDAALSNSAVTDINGVSISDLKSQTSALTGDARSSYLLSTAENRYGAALSDSGITGT
jgi:hypothetical protein